MSDASTGMRIENKVTKVRLPDGRVFTKSAYRYVAPVSTTPSVRDIGPANQPPRERTLRP